MDLTLAALRADGEGHGGYLQSLRSELERRIEECSKSRSW